MWVLTKLLTKNIPHTFVRNGYYYFSRRVLQYVASLHSVEVLHFLLKTVVMCSKGISHLKSGILRQP